MKINKDTVFTTYGRPEFKPEYFRPIINRPQWNKPTGGLWASVDGSPDSWKEWVLGENFYPEQLEEGFSFKISPEAKILKIYSVDDLSEIRLQNRKTFFNDFSRTLVKAPDFEELATKYDGIWMSISEDRRLYMEMYGWDCDSLLLFNKDVMEDIKCLNK